MTKVLAIIRDVGFGLRDIGHPCLFFTVKDGSTCALQIITDYKEIKKILIDANVYDITSLEGKACWVDVEGNQMTFNRMANI